MSDTTGAPVEGGSLDPAPPKRARRGSLISALALIAGLTAVAVLAYVGWQFYGTDKLAAHRQSELRTQVRDRWNYPTVVDVLGPEAGAPSQGSAVALVRIPRFGNAYEVPLIEGVRDGDLKKGIGHFPGAGPGQVGNFAVAGHMVTNGEPFRGLPKLRPGDKVIVETSDASYTYVLDTNPNDLVLPFTETWVIDPVPVPPRTEAPPGMPKFHSTSPTEALITLTSCSELFHSDSRLVSFGHLTSTTPK
jgi:sortase A